MKLKNSYHTYAIITILFWSMAFVLTRLALQHFSSSSLGFMRYFFASLTMIIVVIIGKIKPPAKRDLPVFLCAGGSGFFIYMLFYNKGLEMVTAATGSVVIATVPVITALLARIIYKEKLMIYQWVAIFIEFTGVIVLTLFNGVFSINAGLFLLLLAALALSIYNLLQRKLTNRYSAMQTSAYGIFSGTLLLTIFLPGSIPEVMDAPKIQMLYLLLLGVFPSAVAYAAWATAFAKAEKTSQVSNYMFITPFLTTLFGFIFANEVPDSATLVGGAIILLGVFIYNFGGSIISKVTLKAT